MDAYTVLNPTILTLEKEKDSEQIKVSMNPILFTRGTLYAVQPMAVVGAYQCFDATVHQIYEKTLNGGNNDVAAEPEAREEEPVADAQ